MEQKYLEYTGQESLTSEALLEERLSLPTAPVLQALKNIKGDLMLIGVGGKMGLTMARMAVRALKTLQSPFRVIGVSRFSQPGLQEKLENLGVQTIACDLLDRRAVESLPDSKDLIFMAGRKFGTNKDTALTWATNTYLPTLVGERFHKGRIAVLSTGNVYPLVPIAHGGSQEEDTPAPVGEYGISALGRERIFEYLSHLYGLRCVFLRLNYAIDLRYGVLVDIAKRVRASQPIDLTTGVVNVLWGGDANAYTLASLTYCASPPRIINITGPEIVSIRKIANRFAQAFQVQVEFIGNEAQDALISNAGQVHQLFGYPQVTLNQMIDWIIDWFNSDLPTWEKPTHFQARSGSF